jgi:hypothetical protein
MRAMAKERIMTTMGPERKTIRRKRRVRLRPGTACFPHLPRH